ncbi:hypothetical protein LCGC14_0295930 [marine sediment metagenome]|uniref:Peptidase S54 rhomboid domain-containing protein n=1 Tax=marine sediment metagenome TaxID=412755 RepID=A0A0F9WXP7_9ZZZZ|nr:rhomboid family intramembrane serine protease [Phycisphaerae bacterium]HDZ44180.1 rhomboid family intramembrane serine protease [Phycisphaerae bacterium]
MIPIRTDYRMRIRPWMNFALIGANALIFLNGWHIPSPVIDPFMLQPTAPELTQFFTSMFLHADFQHLAGNMLFLWVFGNALNDRLGHVGYLLFYLGGGVIAGLGYLLLSPIAPVLGASGAISAVTGAYLVLFPRTHVTVLFWFIIITTFQVSSLIFLGLQVAWNFIMSYKAIAISPLGGVAYVAHSSGYLFGIVVSAGLLLTRLLPRDGFDLLYLVRQGFRRRQYRAAVRSGPSPFAPNRLRRGEPDGPRRLRTRAVNVAGRTDTESAQELQLRRDIAIATQRRDFAAAANLYTRIVQLNTEIVLPRQQQLDIANHLMSAERHLEAAEAYERFRRHFASYKYIADIELMLGMIYGRYLQRYAEAAELLEHASKGLTDARKRQLAETELQAARKKLTDPSTT